jgi:hypothetical protein
MAFEGVGPCDPDPATISYAPSLRESKLPHAFRPKGTCSMALPGSLARHFLTLLLGLTFAAMPGRLHAQAQATTGVVRGTVADSAGRPIAGATVTLRHAETNAERSLTTNDQGVYAATLLRVGNYDATGRAVGYRESRRGGIAVGLGETVTLNFSLAPQVVQLQELTVEAEPSKQSRVFPTTAATSSTSPR